MYKWTGMQWTRDPFSLPMNPLPSLPPGMYRSQVPGMEGMILGTPDLGPSIIGSKEPTLLERAASATDAWTRREDESAEAFRDRRAAYSRKELRGMKQDLREAKADGVEGAGDALKNLRHAQFTAGFGGTANGTIASAVGNFADGNWKTGIIDTTVAGVKAIDNLAMGDKNFGAQSEAIDGVVHTASRALLQSGHPGAMIAGAALEGANLLTKAGGETVQGFDVGIESSGYGNLGHMESSSSRDFSAALGPLGALFTGLNKNKMQNKLNRRHEQAMMAMNAANIANEQSFEQEARMNSVQNTLMNNQIALAGGLETSLLGG